ncbi:MAG: DUF669 domain-containing protein [Phycisphaerae bacterium]|nr:DUF669 domain-containing protein [Phycisphaerae bacterium]
MSPVKKLVKKFVKPAAGKGGSAADGLADLQKEWDAAEARTFGAPLPDGQYEGTIEEVLIEKSRNGRLQCRWNLIVTSGDCVGRQIRKFNGLVTQDNLSWFKGDLAALGLEPPTSMSDIGDVLEQAQGMRIAFQVRSRDEFTNVDFIGPLEDGEAAEQTEAPAEEAAEPSGDTPTKADIKKMKRIELVKLAKEYGLDPTDYKKDDDLKDALIEGLGL